MSRPIIGIASGMFRAKKERQRESSLYLNYGLLGLLSNLKAKGYDAVMFQGDYKSIDTIIEEIENTGINVTDGDYTFLLSVPSFLSMDWAVAFTERVKTAAPTNKVIVGGRWVLDNNLQWVKDKFKDCADAYSLGCPDEIVELFADCERWNELEVSRQYQHQFYHLDYTLLHNYRHYQPVLEISRGCGRGCEFCLEKSFAVCPLTPPEDIFRQIHELEQIYETGDLNIYFESSVFLPSVSWSTRFKELYAETESCFKWRCTTRVDAANSTAFSLLADAGLKVVDFGLESASPTQLRNMGKTSNPELYLQKAENIIKILSEKGVWSKLNILLYAEETLETYGQTKEWLAGHKPYIKGISANPLTIYLNGTESTLAYCDEIEQKTSCRVNREELLVKGYVYTDLSPSISKEHALELCKELGDLMMTEKDYTDLKEVCYKGRNVI